MPTKEIKSSQHCIILTKYSFNNPQVASITPTASTLYLQEEVLADIVQVHSEPEGHHKDGDCDVGVESAPVAR